MPTEVKLPHLGESIDSAVVVAWHKRAGDAVERGDELADLETDKATLPLEAPKKGVLLAIVADEGRTVYIGDLLAVIGRAGESWTPQSQSQPEVAAAEKPAAAGDASPAGEPAPPRRYKVSPLARRKARELGVDLAAVRPADGAKIGAADIEAAHAKARASASGEPGHSRIELSPARRLTGQRMLESARSIPQFSLTMDADVGRLLEARSAAKAAGRDFSVTAMLIQMTAKALGGHRRLNARFEDDGITVFESVHMGVAAATDDGLRVPVIHGAQAMSLEQISRSLRALTRKARENRLALAEVSDATFTISNLGMTGVSQFTPLVNPPQTAILGVASPRPVFRPGLDGGIALCRLMALTVACDHRALDGAEAAAFLQTLKDGIESFVVEG